MSSYDVLLTGSETRQSVVVMRALAQHGVRMFVTGHERRSLGFYSRYAASSARLPSPQHDKKAYVDGVIELVRKHDIRFVFAVTETTLLALDEQRPDLEQYAKLLAPPSAVIRAGMDKKHQMAIAERLNIPTARTLYPTSIGEAVEFAESVGYPVVFKPQGLAAEQQRLAVDFKAEYCHTADQVRHFLSQFDPGVYPMLQDFAHGEHVQIHCFAEGGTDIHSPFMDHARRLMPLTGGVGTRLTSIEVVPELWHHAQRFFRELDWEGVAQIQWKGPGKDGRYRFMEVSVRIVASVGSLVYSGVNFPWMHFQYFTGRKVNRVTHYKVNTHSQWLRGDTVAVARYLLDDMPLGGDALPTKSQVFRHYLSDFFRSDLRRDVANWRDPLPAVPELANLGVDLAQLLKRRAARLLRQSGRRTSAERRL